MVNFSVVVYIVRLDCLTQELSWICLVLGFRVSALTIPTSLATAFCATLSWLWLFAYVIKVPSWRYSKHIQVHLLLLILVSDYIWVNG